MRLTGVARVSGNTDGSGAWFEAAAAGRHGQRQGGWSGFQSIAGTRTDHRHRENSVCARSRAGIQSVRPEVMVCERAFTNGVTCSQRGVMWYAAGMGLSFAWSWRVSWRVLALFLQARLESCGEIASDHGKSFSAPHKVVSNRACLPQVFWAYG